MNFNVALDFTTYYFISKESIILPITHLYRKFFINEKKCISQYNGKIDFYLQSKYIFSYL